MRANPWASLISVTAVFIAYMRDMNPVLSEAEERQRMLNQVMGEAETSIKTEQREMAVLLKTARDKTISDGERLEAIRRLNVISPKYFGNLNLENINTGKADEAVKKYTASILANAKAKAINARLDELDKEKLDLQQNPRQLSKWYDPITTGLVSMASDAERAKNAITTLFTRGDFSGWNEQTNMQQNYALNSLDAWGKRYTEKMRQITEDQQALKKQLEEVVKETVTQGSSPEPSGSEPDTSEVSGSDSNAQLQENLKLLEQYFRERENLIKEGYVNQEKTQEEYEKELYDLESARLEAKKSLLEEAGEDISEIQGQIYDRMIAEANKRYEEQQALEKEAREK